MSYLGGYVKQSIVLISKALDCVVLALVCRRALPVVWNHSQLSVPLSACLAQRRFSIARCDLAALLRLSVTFLNLSTDHSVSNKRCSPPAVRGYLALKWFLRVMVALHVLRLSVSVQVAYADQAVCLSLGPDWSIRVGSPTNSSSCKSYKGHAVSCYELQLARDFNSKVMPFLREAPYSKVCRVS